jgi:hypothetical protein
MKLCKNTQKHGGGMGCVCRSYSMDSLLLSKTHQHMASHAHTLPHPHTPMPTHTHTLPHMPTHAHTRTHMPTHAQALFKKILRHFMAFLTLFTIFRGFHGCFLDDFLWLCIQFLWLFRQFFFVLLSMQYKSLITFFRGCV